MRVLTSPVCAVRRALADVAALSHVRGFVVFVRCWAMPSTPALDKLRRLCLSLPETSEKSSWGHPNFIAGKRTFVAYETVEGRPSIAFRVPPKDTARLLTRGQFFATPYGRRRPRHSPTDRDRTASKN